jgi:hypothetical protein
MRKSNQTKEQILLRTPGFTLSAFAEDHGRKAVDECRGGPSEARRAKEGASADFAEEMKDTTAVSPWRLHFCARFFQPCEPALVYL